jgi:hypothetical protein
VCEEKVSGTVLVEWAAASQNERTSDGLQERLAAELGSLPLQQLIDFIYFRHVHEEFAEFIDPALVEKCESIRRAARESVIQSGIDKAANEIARLIQWSVPESQTRNLTPFK